MEIVDILEKLEKIFISWGYLIVFLSSFIEISPLGWILPGGLFLAMAGFFAYSNESQLFFILIFSWLGAWVSFLLAYYLGIKYGLSVAKSLKQEHNAKKAKKLLKNHGPAILTTSMMASLTRFWIAFVAGSQKYSFYKFLFYSGAASLTWSSLMVVVGYLAGAERVYLERNLTRLGYLSWILLFIAIATIYWSIRKKFKIMKNNEYLSKSKEYKNN